jgi:hypothetical protein
MCANCSWAADRQAQRCTDLLHRVEHRGPDTGLVGLDAADRSQGDRDEDQTQAEGHHQDPGQHITEVSRVGIQLGEPEHSAGTEQSPNAGDPPRVHPGHQHRRGLGGDDDASTERQESQPRFERAVAQHLLDVERKEEQHGEHRCPDDQHDHEADPACSVCNDPDG